MSRTVKREGDEIAKESIRANSDGTTTITVEIPGVPKANVKVTVDVVQGVKWLTVTATRASGKKYVNLWQIDGVNSDDITASCEDGLLTINVPSLKKVKNGTHNINVA
jgi:HSP20 family molecular chaperone IbpA